ncbi:hypothetical protein [Spirosoma flavum]|uniref:Chemotaxis protein n=1 Tax=Spirosoma flavum TaxID=2048557 RepID=A0ABW6APS7_9BACT
MKLTVDQARTLSRSYFDLAKTLGEYRFENFDTISPAKRKLIEEFERTLLNASTTFTAIAITISLTELEPVLARIDEVTKQIEANINQLQKIDRVIKIAGAAVQLSGAILSGNPEAILKAANDSVALFA